MSDWLGSDLRIGHFFSFRCPLVDTPQLNTQLLNSLTTESLNSLANEISNQSQSQSYFTTGGLPPVSSSWRQAPWDLRPLIFSTEHLWSWSLCNVLSDERMGLSFTIAADFRQRSHSDVRVPRDYWSHFTVSDSRLPQTAGPRPRIYIPQEQGGPVITQALRSLNWIHESVHSRMNYVSSFYNFEANRIEITISNSSSVICLSLAGKLVPISSNALIPASAFIAADTRFS
jgi:hypothetical protein